MDFLGYSSTIAAVQQYTAVLGFWSRSVYQYYMMIPDQQSTALLVVYMGLVSSFV